MDGDFDGDCVLAVFVDCVVLIAEVEAFCLVGVVVETFQYGVNGLFFVSFPFETIAIHSSSPASEPTSATEVKPPSPR